MIDRVPKRSRGMSASHNHAPKQEATVAARIGGAVVKGSGSGNVKGDARRNKIVRVECKSTIKKSFSVTKEMIDKLEAATFGAGEVPVLQVELLAEDKGKGGQAKVDSRVYVVPQWAMEDLLERVCRVPS